MGAAILLIAICWPISDTMLAANLRQIIDVMRRMMVIVIVVVMVVLVLVQVQVQVQVATRWWPFGGGDGGLVNRIAAAVR